MKNFGATQHLRALYYVIPLLMRTSAHMGMNQRRLTRKFEGIRFDTIRRV